MRDRWLPHPVLSVLIGVGWLLLQRTVSPAQLLTALVLALVLPVLCAPFLPSRSIALGPRQLWATAVLLRRVLFDIVVANVEVARLVLSPTRRPRPAWFELPYELRNDRAVSLLASIITTTPGTLCCRVDEARERMLIHALDCPDPQAMADEIRRRYEAPLKEILG